MIKVSVELWPYGRSDEAESLGIALILNDGTGSDQRGNYEAVFTTHREGAPAPTTRRVLVRDFDRTKDAWHLLHAALTELVSSPGSAVSTDAEKV